MATFQDCIKFANENPTCSLGTIDGDQPRVRIVAMYVADDTGFYFHTEPAKALYKQMKKNSKIELCFPRSGLYRNEERKPDDVEQMRVTGEVEFINDLALNERILKDRPFLKHAGIEKPDDPRLAVFRVSKGEAFFWRLMDTTREAEIPRVKF